MELDFFFHLFLFFLGCLLCFSKVYFHNLCGSFYILSFQPYSIRFYLYIYHCIHSRKDSDLNSYPYFFFYICSFCFIRISLNDSISKMFYQQAIFTELFFQLEISTLLFITNFYITLKSVAKTLNSFRSEFITPRE